MLVRKVQIGDTSFTEIGPATETTLAAILAALSSGVTIAEPVTVDAVNLDIRDLVFASDKVDVSGSSSVGVTGTFWQATQPVSFTGSTDVATQTTLASLLTSSQLIDDAVYTSDGALSKTLGVAAVFDDVATVAITENQAGYLRMSSRRALLVEGVASGTALNVLDTNSAAALAALQTIDNAISGAGFNITQLNGAAVPIGAGLEATALRVTIATDSTGLVSIDDGGGIITVDGTITANLSATDNAVLDAIEVDTTATAASLALLDNAVDGNYLNTNLNIAGTDVAAGSGINGVTVQRVTIATDDEVNNLLGTIDADTGGILTAVQIMDDWDNGASDGASVSGDVAHDTADAGEPVKIGAKVETSLKGITVAADADRTNLYADSDGVQVVKLNTTGADIINERVADTAGTSTAFTNFSAVASTYNYIKTVVIHNAHATTNGYVDIRDGAAGAVKATIPAPATGGAVVNFDPPLKSSANTAFAYDVSAAITTVYITATGWQSKV